VKAFSRVDDKKELEKPTKDSSYKLVLNFQRQLITNT
jgi:hypothetical protein